MTKTTKCTECPSTKIYAAEMCWPCYEYAGYENQHADEGHEDPNMHFDPSNDLRDDCPVCHPELDPRTKRDAKSTRSGHSNTNAAGPHFSHANCAHEPTKAARAKCRKQMRDSKPEDVKCPTCQANVSKGEKCMTRTGKIAKQSHNDRPSK